MSSDIPGTRPDVGRALAWSFAAFRRNPVPYISLAAVVAVIQMVQQLTFAPIQAVLTDCTDPQSPGQQAACEAALGSSLTWGLTTTLLFVVLAFLATIGVLRAALGASRGIPAEFSLLWRTENLGRYILFTLLYVLLVFIGVILCIIPGIIAAILLQFGQLYALDRGTRPVEAAKASTRVIRRHVGPAIVMFLVVLLLGLIGSAFYGILTLIALPFSSLFIVHMFRQYNGEAVA